MSLHPQVRDIFYPNVANSPYADLSAVAGNVMLAAFQGRTSSFFHDFAGYFNAVPGAANYLAKLGRNTIGQLHQNNGWKGDVEKLLEGVTPAYAAIFQALSDLIFVGLDTTKEGYPTALYTRSFHVIKRMVDAGMVQPDNVNKVMKDLTGTKTANGVSEGTFCVVRLDFEQYVNGIPTFKLTVPRSNLKVLGNDAEYMLVPLIFYAVFSQILQNATVEQAFEFEKTSVTGNIRHQATISPNVVKLVYANSDPEDVEAKIRRIHPGYDPIRQRYTLYDLESSVYSLGLASFRPEMLNYVKIINPHSINTACHNVDFDVLRQIFATRIRALKAAQLDAFKYIDLSSYANMTDKQNALIEQAEKEDNRKLLSLMQAHPEIFGDINEALEKRRRIMPKFLKGFQPVELPNTEQERVALLRDLLSKGVVQFVTTTKDGRVSGKLASNNSKVLERIYGKDYVQKYETVSLRIKEVKAAIERGEVKSRKEAEELAVKYNILPSIDATEYLKGGKATLAALDTAIKELEEKSASRTRNPAYVLYRNLKAENSDNFYGQVNVNSLISVEFRAYE